MRKFFLVNVLCSLLLLISGIIIIDDSIAEAGETCPPKVLVVGDSLVGQASGPLQENLGHHVRVVWHGGASAVEYAPWDHPWFFNTPRDELYWHINDFDPDVVVVNWGTNRIWSMWGTEWAFLMEWTTQNAMADVRSHIPDIKWTTIPHRNDGFDYALWAERVNQMVVAGGTPLVPWREATDGPNGGFDPYYFDSDMVHFNIWGVVSVVGATKTTVCS